MNGLTASTTALITSHAGVLLTQHQRPRPVSTICQGDAGQIVIACRDKTHVDSILAALQLTVFTRHRLSKKLDLQEARLIANDLTLQRGDSI